MELSKEEKNRNEHCITLDDTVLYLLFKVFFGWQFHFEYSIGNREAAIPIK